MCCALKLVPAILQNVLRSLDDCRHGTGTRAVRFKALVDTLLVMVMFCRMDVTRSFAARVQ